MVVLKAKKNLSIKQSILYKGCDFAFRTEGAGPPVLFIQGVGVHGCGWQPQTRMLANQYQCLSFDNRGIGNSKPAATRLSVEQMADDARALLDSQGWQSAHVVGHSLGGLVALHLALTDPKRVRSLSLLCTFARGRDATKPSPWMLWVGLRTRIGTRRQRRNAFLQLVVPPEELRRSDRTLMASHLAGIFGHDLAHQPSVVMSQMKAMNAYDATPRLAELAGIPTLVVSATHDPIAKPKFGQGIAKAIPGARYIELEDASHGVTIHRADRINGLLLDHFGAAAAAGK